MDGYAITIARLEQDGYSVRSAYSAVRDPGVGEFVYQDAQYRGADVLGVGVSSFSYLSGAHAQNVARLETYMKTVAGGELPLNRGYALNADEQLLREFVLQLKLGSVKSAPLR